MPFNSPYNAMKGYCSGTARVTTQRMTLSDYDAIVQDVVDIYDGLSKFCSGDVCPTADFAGCVLRIAGHDFMDYDAADGLGGSDGCLDLSDADNNGLHACMYQGSGAGGASIVDAYVNWCTQIGLADFFVIAAEAMMNRTRQNALTVNGYTASTEFRAHFRYGRTTRKMCAFAEGRLPNPEDGCGAVERVFMGQMGLTYRLTAALMGVHTLGRADPANSGYEGWWSDAVSSRRFNNNYYVSMLAKGWVPEKAVGGNAAKNQWRRSDIGEDEAALGKEMMLDTDLCLAFSGDTCTGTSQASCSSADLSAANTNCCAWAGPNDVQAVFSTYLGGSFCGRTGALPTDFGELRRLCCCESCAAGSVLRDCGLPPNRNGLASQFVDEFASDDSKWLKAFQLAWTKATENGFSGLTYPS